MPEVKDWGTTECLLKTPFMQLHRLEVKAGGYCSIHRHAARYNLFFVESGMIRVTRYTDDGIPLVYKTLHHGERYLVKPGLMHSFEVLLDGVVFEAYYPEGVLDEDIFRLKVGGYRAPRS